MTDTTDARALYFPADDDGNPDSWQVQAGEYADEPDLVILIEHAVDSDGNDMREGIARLDIEQHARSFNEGYATAMQQVRALIQQQRDDCTASREACFCGGLDRLSDVLGDVSMSPDKGHAPDTTGGAG